MTDMLQDFAREPFTADGKTKDIYRLGTGPAVIVISEIPGITPEVAGFARKVARRGCTAVMPHLFGDPGKPISTAYTVKTLTALCISREFNKLALRAVRCDHDVAARAGRGRARTLRRTWRRRRRHVLHGRVRPRDDGRRQRGRAGAQPALRAVPVRQGAQGRRSGSRTRTSAGSRSGWPAAPACSDSGSRATRWRRAIGSRRCAASSATASSGSSSTPRKATRTAIPSGALRAHRTSRRPGRYADPRRPRSGPRLLHHPPRHLAPFRQTVPICPSHGVQTGRLGPFDGARVASRGRRGRRQPGEPCPPSRSG